MLRTNLTLATLFVTLAAPRAARADDPPGPRAHYATVNGVDPARPNALQADLSLGVIGVAYERVVDPIVSLNVALQFYAPWYMDAHIYGATVEVRPFFFVAFGTAPTGIYVSPFLRLGAVGSDLGNSTSSFTWSVGATVGYSLLLWQRVNIRLGIGPQYFGYTLTAADTVIARSTFYPAVDIILGWSF